MDCLRDRFYDGVILDGRFETVSPLNHGSFGMVFMAKDLVTNEYVAIKCLTKKSDDFDSSFAVDERSEELACHARLGSHPYIVNLIHSFETEAHIYIVLEYCSQGDLYEAIRTGTGPLETEHVREFMLQLVDAVAYIHSKGMYHRDIKPENIFLTHSGNMKLGDFGLATSDSWSYETGVGSDRYMAPEQYDSAQAGYAPDKADIWAIGICLLNILFSRNPFTTPTESDPLFLDFSRDKQSLFDVFPTMSQDTYEIIAQCMSLDPRKRDLDAVREALERTVSFTTFDDPLDDFCASDKPVLASANREPLRTPSVQSPHVDTGSFPWAKALHASPPQHIRQLSVIPDTESYTEDLFPRSEESNKDWFSVGQQNSSLGSILNSSLGASMKSMAIRRPIKTSPPKATYAPVSGSLPISMSKPKPLPSLSSVFGKKNDVVSKSWSDLWDEEIEEEEEEQAEKQLKARQMQNARTYSHESLSGDVTLRVGGPLEPLSDSSVNIGQSNMEASHAKDIDLDLVADGFFFHDEPAHNPVQSPPRYSPPPKRTTFDKWSALGDRRRAYPGSQQSEKSPDLWKSKRNVGLGFVGFGSGVWDNKAHTMFQEKKTCPHGGRARATQPPRKYSRGQVGDLEWVSGWSDVHL